MPFSQIILPSPSPTESKRLFYTSVSLLLSRMQGYHYHLSKFHIYALLLLMLSRFSRVRLCTTPWTAAFQASPSLGFPRQEYWSGVPLPFPIYIIAHYLKFFISFKRVLSFVMIPRLGKYPGEGNGNPLQDSCLESPMDRGAWWATVHGVTKS